MGLQDKLYFKKVKKETIKEELSELKSEQDNLLYRIRHYRGTDGDKFRAALFKKVLRVNLKIELMRNKLKNI